MSAEHNDNPFGLVYGGAITENVSGKVQIHPVTYRLNNIEIAANVYTPPNYTPDGGLPAIVVAHPNGGVKEQVAGLYAQRLAEQGYITITADAAYQGASGGQPRNVDKPAHRIEDIHGMADYITRYPGVDSSRLGLLGICGGGGYSLKAAQGDKRFRAIATLSMINSGRVRRNGFADSQRDTIQQRLKQATDARAQEAADGEVLYSGDANLTDEQIAELPFELYRQGYEYYWKTHAHPCSTFKYTTSSLLDLMSFDATNQIELIDTPLLMIAGSKADSLYMTEDAVEKATGTKDKELFTIEGATHIETYWVPQYVNGAVDKLKTFFTRTLGSVSAQNEAPQTSTQSPTQSRAQALMGDITPKLAELTDDVLFGDVWERPELSKRDRSLVTVSALIAMNRPDQLRSHLALAQTNGVKREELTEAITHLAFYAGWPSAVTAAGVAKEVCAATPPPATAAAGFTAPLLIQEQGSFAIGGTVSRQPGTYHNNQPTAEGQSFHGDHLYAFYQTPVNPKPLPIVMLHGAYQSARSWETTSDGREGFRDIFLRRGFSVYLVDQPRRGRAGNSTVATTTEPTPYDQLFFDQFRIGTWPRYFDGVQFDRKPETLNQFFRSITPNTGPYDAEVISDAMSALFDKTGPGILFTHSQGGGPGWLTAIKNRNVKAIVAFEPGSGFVFPTGQLPAAMPSAAGTLTPEEVSPDEFKALTRIPIIIYYGDNIPTEPTERRGEDNWRVRLAMAKLWVAAVNRQSGNARLVHLPEIGIRGNTHFLFSDLNNVEIADQVSAFLGEENLDK